MVVFHHLFNTCEVIANQRVLKKYNHDSISLGLFENELKWYKRFSQIPNVPPHIPKMLDYSRDTLVLEYVGAPITKETIPVNFKDQLRIIASLLKYHRCHHCDIIPGNLLIFNTNLFIIDFGWALEEDQDPYRKWRHVEKAVLDNIGGSYRSRQWPDDKYSLIKIYRELSGNTTDKLLLY